MPIATIKNMQATWVRAGAWTKKNLSAEKRLVTRASGEIGIGLLNFSLPAPRGVVYKSAKLKLYNSAAIAGSETTYISRITSPWSPTKVTYSTRPTATTSGRVGVTKNNAPKDALWEFDITAMLNSASNGTNPWYGLWLSSAASTGWRYFYHPAASSTFAPVLEVEWYENPIKPSMLNPKGLQSVSKQKPTFQTDFYDVVGSTVMTALQLQIDTGIDFAPVLWDSGVVMTDQPELDLSDTTLVPSPPTLAVGGTYIWRVRVRDNTDLWSPWSDMAPFRIDAKGTVSITSPAEAPNNYIEETSPPILWTVSGMTQEAFEVLVWNEDKTELILGSGRINGADDSYTLRPNTRYPNPFKPDETYHLELRIWDTVERATTPGDPAYVVAEREFTYKETNTVSPVTDLTVTTGPADPWAVLTASRGTAPDLFSMWRDGVCIVDNIDPSNVDIGGGQYRFVDKRATPRTPHTWEIKANVNGKTSSGNAKVTKEIKPTTAFLSDYNGAWSVPFLNYSPSIGAVDGSSTTTVMNSDEAITVYQGGSAREGDFVGLLSGALGPTARQHLANILSMKKPANRGKPVVLTYADQSIVCSISQIMDAPVVYSEEIAYSISFHLTERRI